jgi:hypothetical protein
MVEIGQKPLGLKVAQAGERTGQLFRPRPRLRPGRRDCSGGWLLGRFSGPRACGNLGRARTFGPKSEENEFRFIFSRSNTVT